MACALEPRDVVALVRVSKPPNVTVRFRFLGASECHCTVPGGPSLFPPSTLPDFPPLTRGRNSPGGVYESARPLRSAPARRGSVIRFLGVWCVVGRARVLTARKAQCHPESPWHDRKGALRKTSVHFGSEQRNRRQILMAKVQLFRLDAITTPVDECRGLCSRLGWRHSHAVCRWLYQPIANGISARLKMIRFWGDLIAKSALL